MRCWNLETQRIWDFSYNHSNCSHGLRTQRHCMSQGRFSAETGLEADFPGPQALFSPTCNGDSATQVPQKEWNINVFYQLFTFLGKADWFLYQSLFYLLVTCPPKYSPTPLHAWPLDSFPPFSPSSALILWLLPRPSYTCLSVTPLPSPLVSISMHLDSFLLLKSCRFRPSGTHSRPTIPASER